jgi:hypothetical protein
MIFNQFQWLQTHGADSHAPETQINFVVDKEHSHPSLMSVNDLLTGYIDLSQNPITKINLNAFISFKRIFK